MTSGNCRCHGRQKTGPDGEHQAKQTGTGEKGELHTSRMGLERHVLSQHSQGGQTEVWEQTSSQPSSLVNRKAVLQTHSDQKPWMGRAGAA